MTTAGLEIREDRSARRWLVKELASGALETCQRWWLPSCLVTVAAALLGVFVFSMPPAPLLAVLLITTFPLVIAAGFAVAAPVCLALPQRWHFTERGIRARGREIGGIEWRDVRRYTLTEARGMAGYHVLVVSWKRRLAEGSWVIVIPPGPELNVLRRVLVRHAPVAGPELEAEAGAAA